MKTNGTQERIKFSLRTRLTLLVGLVVLVSILISAGLSALLEWLFPIFSKIPRLLQMPIFSLGVAMVATNFLSKLFFDPIKKLRLGMKQVGEGNFNVKLEENSSSLEIREVMSGFNLMTEELRSTEILQTDFVSNVSHEFKTPINAIEGYAMLLQGEELSPEQQEYTEKILSNTRRLSTLVSNILLLSKIENQSIRAPRERYALAEQIRESIVALEPSWSGKDLGFDVELEEVFYCGNEAMMRHVWDNLIANAIKFSPPDAEIRIRLNRQGERLIFSIEDRGPGLSEEAKKHIFDKFYQQDTSHKEEGNGLGLTLVKRILTVDGGEVSAENLPSGGCRFTVIL